MNAGDFKCPRCGAGVLYINETEGWLGFTCGARGRILSPGKTAAGKVFTRGGIAVDAHVRVAYGTVELEAECNPRPSQ